MRFVVVSNPAPNSSMTVEMQLVVAELVALLLDVDQLREQVVGRVRRGARR